MRSLIARRDTPRAAPRNHDPAPSRLSYRAQRLWLTPLFRTLVRVGLPAAAICGVALIYVSDEENLRAIQDRVAETVRNIQDRPEFRVSLMAISGASEPLAEEIRQTLSLEFPTSSFDLDLPTLRTRVEELPAVAGAELRIQSGGELWVSVVERQPQLIWQARDGHWLIDETGARVAHISERPELSHLPVVAGDGADLAAAQALEIYAAAGPLGERLRGLVRMGERRWDVVLEDDLRVLLPAESPRAALDTVLLMDDAQDLLARDLIRVDMRQPSRPVLQLGEHALQELRRMRGQEIASGGPQG